MAAALRIARRLHAAYTVRRPRTICVARRLLTWLLTGPVGHFLAGALDFAEALTRWALARRRAAARR